MLKRIFYFFLFLNLNVALAFPGFYVSKKENNLTNKSSRLFLVHDTKHITMILSTDYLVKAQEFALLIPIPSMIDKSKIQVIEPELIDHIDQFTSPRIIENTESNPCEDKTNEKLENKKIYVLQSPRKYNSGHYEFTIFNPKENGNIKAWLQKSGYKIPKSDIGNIESYSKKNLKFVFVKINSPVENTYVSLKPIKISYESEHLILPIRLGAMNAPEPQEITIFTMTRAARVEISNYRTVSMPTDLELPTYAKDNFTHTYKAIFNKQVVKENMKPLFLEYAGFLGPCIQCKTEQLTPDQLKQLDLTWAINKSTAKSVKTKVSPTAGPRDVFITRLHARYANHTFFDDIALMETKDQNRFQALYSAPNPWKGTSQCKAAELYLKNSSQRAQEQAQNLARVTGWKLSDILKKMNSNKK